MGEVPLGGEFPDGFHVIGNSLRLCSTVFQSIGFSQPLILSARFFLQIEGLERFVLIPSGSQEIMDSDPVNLLPESVFGIQL